MIGIIDYGMGNLRSVQKAFHAVGAEAVILSGPADVMRMDRLVLPGVGAFGDGMAHLEDRRFIEPIHRFIASGRPLLGICLGMQLLFANSQENAGADGSPVPGLAILPGSVIRFQERPPGYPGRIKVPHMGWNTLSWSRADPLLRGLHSGAAVYFVHGYHVPVIDGTTSTFVSAAADYPAGMPFCATVWRDNIWATQFHPEKSQNVGLTMLRNFAAL